jgi:hypothetical protein
MSTATDLSSIRATSTATDALASFGLWNCSQSRPFLEPVTSQLRVSTIAAVSSILLAPRWVRIIKGVVREAYLTATIRSHDIDLSGTKPLPTPGIGHEDDPLPIG